MNKEKINIETINKQIIQKKVIWTKHCLNRLNQRKILIYDIEVAISKGNIIEYYYDDYPYPSCLILGRDNNNKEIHIVCGICEEYICIITAYHPNIDKWEIDMKTRRENNEMLYV